jgi:enoyl-CoA hydratase/carnithine racemase
MAIGEVGVKMRARLAFAGTIVNERVSAGNAFTEAMVRQLGEIIRRAAEEADIVTLSGAGANFTIGRDRGEAGAARHSMHSATSARSIKRSRNSPAC